VAATLVIVATGIGALATVINGQAGWRLGSSLLASVTFAGMAVAADLLALILPTAAASLWHARRPGMAVLAWLTWTLAATLTTLASIGYVELHTSDTAAGRRAIVATRAAVTDQRAAGIAAAQLAANAARRAQSARSAGRDAANEKQTNAQRSRRLRLPSRRRSRPWRPSPTRTRRSPRRYVW
jgi:hypothetical protein